MAGSDEANAIPTKGTTGATSRPSGLGATPEPNLITITLDTDTGRIVKVEKVDSAGARQDLSDEDAASLTKGNPLTLAGIIEQAFEAGIACVLGDEPGQDETEESADDAAFSRLLLMPLIERSPAHDLKQPDVLVRALLGSVIEQTTSSRGGESEASPQQEGGSTAKSRPSMRPGPAHQR
jgi:hypothetical protein